MRTFNIAGVQFHQMKTIINDLNVGDELTLIPEPENPHDSNAVAIMCEGVMCGYVPGTLSAEISALVEAQGDNVTCIIQELNPQLKPWEWCKVAVGTVDEFESEEE